ncbi:hypothetical protein MTR67_038673 [Solanum verrucosum]|uniref:Uncharacterized protein n=1 Tax=Solanum verrucosum TaxID=315347 RepID=A0AAF0ZPP8_SOLVR|nr:hypothetical protein MTR67_038673 [Solanum verrucosum]
MSSGGDSDRHREHLGVSQTKQAKKKKSRRPIDAEDIAGSISSAPERINHDTHLFAVSFGYSLSTTLIGRYSISRRWHPAKDAARALKDYYVYLGVEYWNTDKFKAISDQAKKARGSLKGDSLHTGGAKMVGTIAREIEKELGRTLIKPEVFKKTHVRKKENESDLNVWVEERAERTLSERRRVAEQESMSETVHQIKEQVMNLARQPTISAPDDTDDESDEDDYVDPTP